MQLNTFNFIVLILTGATSSTDALGINCRGSAKCTAIWGGSGVAQDLTNVINNIDENRWYYNGEHIACVGNQAGNGGGWCAFLQGTGGAPGRNIKGLAHFIPEHGCKICGSVPYFYPSDNNVDNGELTYNFVDNPCNIAGTQLSGAVVAGIGVAVGALTGYSTSLQRLAALSKRAADVYKYKAAHVAFRIIGSGILTGGSTVLTKAAGRWIGNTVYGRNNDIWGSWKQDLAIGFLTGLASSGITEVVDKYGKAWADTLKDTWKIKFSFSDVYNGGAARNDEFFCAVENSSWTMPAGNGDKFLPRSVIF